MNTEIPKRSKAIRQREVPQPDTSRVEGIFTADWHLSHKPPLARSVEPDWLATQRGYLVQLEALQLEHKCPIICAGDVFDKPDPPAELVNLALAHMPHVYALPGNHDLRMGNYQDLHKTAFYTLVKAGKITLLDPKYPASVNGMQLHAFPHSFPPKPREDWKNSLVRDIAVCHCYCWVEGKSYPDAPESHRLRAYKKVFASYDCVVIGDNHLPFKARVGGTLVVNCGSLVRRNVDQRDYRPRVWLYKADNTAEPYYLDVSKDRFLEEKASKEAKEVSKDLTRFLEGLKGIKDVIIDFREAVQAYLRKHKIGKEIEQIILAALEEGEGK